MIEKVFVKSDEDIKNIKPRPKYIEFNCSTCGKLTAHSYRKTWRFPMFCKSCMSKKNNTPEIMALKLKKAIDKYGSKEALYEAQKKKREETNLKKYGVKSLFELKDFQNELNKKAKEAIKKKYGVINPSQIKEVREANKLRWTPEMKKEQADWFKSKEFKIKSKRTCFEKYGVSNGGGSEDAIKKIQKTKIEKYGLGHIEKKYKYNNEVFDSSWELAFYIYCIDNSILVEHETEKIEYYCEGIKHYYFPDFKIGNEFIEIKGDQFFKDGEFINPYGKTTEVMKAKFRCMLDNNVKILKKKDCKKYLDYVNLKYGKDYLKKFRQERKVV